MPQRAFEGHREGEATAEVQRVGGILVDVGDVLDLGLGLHHLLHLVGDGVQLVQQPVEVTSAQGALLLADHQGHQGENGDLGGEGLGAGHADLRPGVGVERPVGEARDGAVHDVRDGEHLRPRAEVEVRGSLLLEALGKSENLTATDADVEAKYEEIAKETGMPAAQVKTRYAAPDAQESLKVRIVEEKAIALVRQHANWS